MERHCRTYDTYVEILRRELVCAMGCTEPIAIAFCAAKARSVLGELPERIEVMASGNIIKNVKSVVVPNTNGGRGIAVAAALGVLGGDAEAGFQVVANVPQSAKDALRGYLEKTPVKTLPSDSEYLLDITVTVYALEKSASVRVVNEHTNIVEIKKNGETLFSELPGAEEPQESDAPDYELLTVTDIYDFAESCNLDDVRDILARQVECNTAIAEEGLKNDYGANIGKVLLKTDPTSVRTRAKAYAAAGSDARMNGCELPVVINSGSGNQGMTASLPVIEYAKEWNVSEDKLYRALLISNLITLHEKTSIGRLSAYCGAVSAGAGAGCGIAYLNGGGVEEISHTIVNALAVTSGIVCDGAKSSCAAKIAMAVESGIFGYEMYQNGQQFYGGDGLVVKGVENSIASFGRLGRVGMKETDREIIKMMTE